MQLALREWRGHLTQPVTLMALAAIALVLAIMGPFSTSDVMRFLPRLAYWVALVFAGYAWGGLVDVLVRLWQKTPLPWVWVALSGLFTGAGVTAIVYCLNWLALDYVVPWREAAAFLTPIFAISIIIAFALNLIARQVHTAPEERKAPALLDRLPLDKRGALVALSVEDHYVRVRTLRGEELVLMRLSDAIREVGATVGAQVHRSHWIAFGQVVSARREGDRAILTMTGDLEIPVSRANIPKIKEAGLLPERR